MNLLIKNQLLRYAKSENIEKKLLGVIVQLGGQTPLKLSEDLSKSGIRILGTSFKSIDLCEDRDSFSKLMDRLGINQPKKCNRV